MKHRRKKSGAWITITVCAITVLLGLLISYLTFFGKRSVDKEIRYDSPAAHSVQKIEGLPGRQLYNDSSRQIHAAVRSAQQEGETEKAFVLNYLATQPAATWLNGPSDDDSAGASAVETVSRTSSEADKLHQVAIYQIYAIPNRDACAQYSKGGFQSADAYLDWIKQIANALKGDSVFLLEADAIAHAINNDCMNQAEADARFALIKETVNILNASDYAIGIYLDVGHPDWITDYTELIEPLRASGVEEATGIVVNVSNYVDTPKTLVWTQSLLKLLGDNKRAVIDTSRNGNGTPGPEITGEDRWCNTEGRAIGELPTTVDLPEGIDAYLWVKSAGESDGACRGYPQAGTFVEDLAIMLYKNRPVVD